jgi:hypothetical protein
MGVWETSAFAISGNDLDVQDALRAIGRLIESDTLTPATRAALRTASEALQGEPADWAPPSTPIPLAPAMALFLSRGEPRTR